MYCTACSGTGRHKLGCPYKDKPIGEVQSPYAKNLPDSLKPEEKKDIHRWMADRATDAILKALSSSGIKASWTAQTCTVTPAPLYPGAQKPKATIPFRVPALCHAAGWGDGYRPVSGVVVRRSSPTEVHLMWDAGSPILERILDHDTAFTGLTFIAPNGTYSGGIYPWKPGAWAAYRAMREMVKNLTGYWPECSRCGKDEHDATAEVNGITPLGCVTCHPILTRREIMDVNLAGVTQVPTSVVQAPVSTLPKP